QTYWFNWLIPGSATLTRFDGRSSIGPMLGNGACTARSNSTPPAVTVPANCARAAPAAASTAHTAPHRVLIPLAPFPCPPASRRGPRSWPLPPILLDQFRGSLVEELDALLR